jgi:hypothetical protein
MSLEEIADFNNWLGEQPHRYKIVVAGNHDLLFEMPPDKARRLLTNAVGCSLISLKRDPAGSGEGK